VTTNGITVQEMAKTDTQVSLRTTTEEWERWQKLASEQGQSAAAWMREACRRAAAGASHREDGGLVVTMTVPEAMAAELERRAAEELRTPDAQALFLLLEALKGGAK